MEPGVLDRLEDESRGLAERLADPVLTSMMVGMAGSARLMAGDVQGAVARYLETARQGEETRDADAKAGMWVGATIGLAHTGPLSEGLLWADRVISLCAGNPDLGTSLLGYGALGRAHLSRAGVLVRMGRLNEARSTAEQAVTIGRARGEAETFGWALALLPLVAWLTGDGSDTSSPADEAVRVGEETGNVASLVLALEGRALSDLSTGRAAEAAAACEQALAVGRARRSGLFAEASVLAYLARARLATGDRPAAQAAAHEAVAVARRQGARVNECLALLTRAQVAAADPRACKGALADLEAALAVATGQTGALTYEPFIREERARLRGDESELHEAARLYEAIGATGHARRLRSELAGSPTGSTPAGSS
jgi:tetratricopeptide (TPR) repeat protein